MKIESPLKNQIRLGKRVGVTDRSKADIFRRPRAETFRCRDSALRKLAGSWPSEREIAPLSTRRLKSRIASRRAFVVLTALRSEVAPKPRRRETGAFFSRLKDRRSPLRSCSRVGRSKFALCPAETSCPRIEQMAVSKASHPRATLKPGKRRQKLQAEEFVLKLFPITVGSQSKSNIFFIRLTTSKRISAIRRHNPNFQRGLRATTRTCEQSRWCCRAETHARMNRPQPVRFPGIECDW